MSVTFKISNGKRYFNDLGICRILETDYSKNDVGYLLVSTNFIKGCENELEERYTKCGWVVEQTEYDNIAERNVMIRELWIMFAIRFLLYALNHRNYV